MVIAVVMLIHFVIGIVMFLALVADIASNAKDTIERRHNAHLIKQEWRNHG